MAVGLRSKAALVPRLLALAALTPSVALGFPEGIAKGGTTCGGCHGNDPTPSLDVSIDRPDFDPQSLMPDEMAMYTLTISEMNRGGALNVAIDGGGSLAAVDSNTKLLSAEVVHADAFIDPPAGNLGVWSYNFMVNAPNEEGAMLTISAVGMAYTDDEDPRSGDPWNTTTLSITVPEPGAAVLRALVLATLALLAAARRRREQRA